MEVVFTHETALAYWRRYGSPCSLMPQPSRRVLLPEHAPSVDLIEQCARALCIAPASELHVLARKPSNRAMPCYVVGHSSAVQFPSGSFVKAGDEVFIESPELSFVRAASAMPLARAIEYGCELCGAYAMAPWSERGFRDRAAVSTPARLRAFVLRAGGMKGAKRAQRAARYVVDGSASPMETVLYLLLCLPWNLGGYNIPKPVMNARVYLNKATCRYGGAHRPDRATSGPHGEFVDSVDDEHAYGWARKVGKRYRVCDLYWPDAHLAVEYDSSDYHALRSRISSDAVRRNELEERGEMVITVTFGQVKNPEAMEVVARQVSKRLGRQLRCKSKSAPGARDCLRKVLIGHLLQGD